MNNEKRRDLLRLCSAQASRLYAVQGTVIAVAEVTELVEVVEATVISIA